MSEYELMYIVPTSYTEDELGTVESNVAQIIEKNGATIVKTKRLGKFKFAYAVKGQHFGHYVLVRFSGETSVVAGIENGLRLSQKEILRHLIARGDEVSETFNLVQFQEVHVEGTDARRRRTARTEKGPEEGEAKEQEQKEGVAAIENVENKSAAVVEQGIEKLSEEDLQKKIDEALEEKTK